MSKHGLPFNPSRSNPCIGELPLCFCFLYVVAPSETQTVYCFVSMAAFLTLIRNFFTLMSMYVFQHVQSGR